MKKIYLLLSILFPATGLLAQNNHSITIQTGNFQYAEIEQEGLKNDVLIQQLSFNKQETWVLQTGEMKDELTGVITPGGEENTAVVSQTWLGSSNKSFLYQYGSFNESYQLQNGSGNEFNIAGNFPDEFSDFDNLPEDAVPNQDGDYHLLSQVVNGDLNQAWLYQAGREHTAIQLLNGDENQVWTSQSGNTHSATMLVNGNRNGSHYLEHGEGKFPHDEEEDENGHSGGNGGSGGGCGGGHGSGGGSGSGGPGHGMPEVLPPPHDEDHVFVPTVGVSIKQMGKSSVAEMYIEGDDNKATIIQRGGAGGQSCEGGHYVNQIIFGNWNRVFADQRGTSHNLAEFVSGDNNLVLLMQKGNGSNSFLDLYGSNNEAGVDQKGKNNYSDVDIIGQYNGNLIPGEDEFGVKISQEGRANNSDLDILGDYNLVDVHQNGGALSTVNIVGSYNTVTVNQESEH